MQTFLKIGLPWAISMGMVFYLGLMLGEKNQNPRSLFSSSLPVIKNEDPSTIHSEKISGKSKKESKEQYTRISSPVSPPLPPNLIRIMRGTGIIERMGAYLDAVRAMDRSNVQDVVAAFEALPKGYGRHLEMKLLMRSWAAIDPIEALEYANQALDEKSERRFGISEILAGWANEDLDAALTWARANHQSAEPKDNPLLVGIIKGLAENDLDAANEIFLSLPDGSARWQASAFLAQEYCKKGTEVAIRWADSLPMDDLRMRETILGQLGSRLARLDLEGTAKWVSSLNQDSASERVMDNLLSHWVTQNPRNASVWVGEIKKENQRYYAMKQLASRWSLVDPVATARWLNKFPPSPKLDPVVSEFVSRISARDPEGAVGWAQSIIDPSTKQKALDKALDAWDQTSPQAAEKWRSVHQFERR